MATEALDAAATNETLKKVDPLGEIKEKPEPVGDLCKAGDEANGKSCCQEKEEPLKTKATTNGVPQPALKPNGTIEDEDEEGQDEEPEGENEYSSDEEEEDEEGGEEEKEGEGEGYEEEEEEEEEYAEDGEGDGDEDEDDNDESELPPPKRRK